MVALPAEVLEVEKFPVFPAQDPDVNCNVPSIEEEVQVALKDAAPDPVIFA